MSNFGAYPGEKFLTLDIPPRDWLVESLIRKLDSVILVGNEKSGKSLLIFQLICSLTSKHPFIDKYNVPEASKVTYIQLEGELGDSQDRMKRMIKTLDIDTDYFQVMFYPPLELSEKKYVDGLCNEILKFHKPDVLIIDPIYFAFNGSLNDDDMVRRFIGNIRTLKDRLQCAIILVHHTHRDKWSYDGSRIQEGDEAIFGSKFFKAWADHTLLFIYDKEKEIRTLSCNTQRSGDIIKQCNLRLIEPEPLYFEELEHEPTKELLICNLLMADSNHGLTVEEITKRLNISRCVFYNSIKKPLTERIIVKVDKTKPKKYMYNREKLIKKGVTDGIED